MRNPKYNPNELVYEMETDSRTQNRLAAAKPEREEGWEFGISRWKLLCME